MSKFLWSCVFIVLHTGVFASELKPGAFRYKLGHIEKTQFDLLDLLKKDLLLAHFKKDVRLTKSDTGIIILGTKANSNGEYLSVKFNEIIGMNANGRLATEIDQKYLWKYWAYDLEYQNNTLKTFRFTQFELAEFAKPTFYADGVFKCENHEVYYLISEYDNEHKPKGQRKEKLAAMSC